MRSASDAECADLAEQLAGMRERSISRDSTRSAGAFVFPIVN
jgi:hypothetical protein